MPRLIGRFWGVFAVVCLCFGGLAAHPNSARAQVGGIVEEVVVKGAQRISPGTVRSFLFIKPGDIFATGPVDRSLKSLFASGLFADVSLRREGDSLIVEVTENPIINRIAFEGNKVVDDDVLESEISLRSRNVYTRAKVQEDLRRILGIYQASGRFAATVEPKIIRLPQNRVDVAFEINEGEQTDVSRIRFVGNKSFEDDELRAVIQTEESIWYKFLSSNDTYDPDRLTLDKELLRQHYLANGFADFRVNSSIAELTPDRESFFVTFSIEEGQRYRVGAVKIKTAIKRLNADELRETVDIEDGEIYDASKVDKTISVLTDRVGELGFAFVEIRPRLRRDRDKLTIELEFEIRQGPRVFVERIDITGNVRTKDKVIRREFRLVEGDAFSTAKLRRSRQRIQNLNFFSRVNVEQRQGSAPDKTIIAVDVREQSTGEVSFGAGFSSDQGVLGDFGITERNFLGTGRVIDLSLLLAGRRSEIDLSFTEPFFLDRDIRATGSLFRITQDLQDFSAFDTERTGFRFNLNYPITETLRQTFGFRFLDSAVENVDDDASAAIEAEEGANIISEVTHAITYDVRDSSIDPSQGFRAALTTNVAGLGGDTRFVRNNLTLEQFFSVGKEEDKFVLSVKGRGAYVFGINDDVLLQERFFVGGNDLRGFETGGVGPRDVITDDALGAELLLTGSVQLSFPFPFGEEFGFRGRLFSDFGSASSLEFEGEGIEDDPGLRLSVGAGLSFISPLGPVGFDLGFAVLQEEADETEVFRVNFGTRF